MRFSTSTDPDELYRLGRDAWLAGYEAQAMALFKGALKLDQRHVDSRNGIAVILHARNRSEEALEMLRLALIDAPSSEMLLRNQARIQLEGRSVTARALPNESSLPVVAISAESALAPVAASSLRLVSENVYELVSPASVPVSAAVTPAVMPTVKVADSADQKGPVAPVPREPLPTLPSQSAAIVSSPIRPVAQKPMITTTDPRVLIANGVGRKGLACRESKALVLRGWKSQGCVDYKNFTQRKSVIYYVAGKEMAARELRMALLQTNPVAIRKIKSLSHQADLQVVIGHDWPLKSPVV
jgi:LytR cell envelope-related transcriptional attenuator